MKTAIIIAICLSAAVAAAETKITEYPDHYVAEATGTPDAGTASAPEDRPPAPSAKDDGVVAQRAALLGEIQRLQKERQELSKTQEWEPPEVVKFKKQESQQKHEEIKQLMSELKKLGEQK